MYQEATSQILALECLKVKLSRYRHTVAPTHFQKQVGRGTWLGHVRNAISATCASQLRGPFPLDQYVTFFLEERYLWDLITIQLG